MKNFNLAVIIVVVTLIIFIFLNTFTYEEFRGGSGAGYELGFALGVGSYVVISLLLCILIGYLPSWKLINKKRDKD